MQTITLFVPQTINRDLLDQQLRAGLSAAYDSVGTTTIDATPAAQIVFTNDPNTDPVSDADQVTCATICAAHDPTQPSAAQIAATQAQAQQATVSGEVTLIAQRIHSFDLASLTDLPSVIVAFNSLMADLDPILQVIDGLLKQA
jgi:hypothetical protein